MQSLGAQPLARRVDSITYLGECVDVGRLSDDLSPRLAHAHRHARSVKELDPGQPHVVGVAPGREDAKPQLSAARQYRDVDHRLLEHRSAADARFQVHRQRRLEARRAALAVRRGRRRRRIRVERPSPRGALDLDRRSLEGLAERLQPACLRARAGAGGVGPIVVRVDGSAHGRRRLALRRRALRRRTAADDLAADRPKPQPAAVLPFEVRERVPRLLE